MGDTQERKAWQELKDRPVATINLQELPVEELVDLAAAKKTRMEFAKAEMDVVNYEIQNRAVAFQEDRHIKFTEWAGNGKALASVTVTQKFNILNYYKLRELLGAELVDDKIKIKQEEVKYDIDDAFKKALIAVYLDDYERGMTVREVVEKSGWCTEDPKKQEFLLKKLKGDYKKDKKTVLDALNMRENEINIDEELYLIYQIENWRLITAFFEEANFEKTAESVKNLIYVDENVKIGVRAG